ncbi:hypothetical protein [Acaryochloris sp. IP29b_bin.148]|uniref:hypothetical protein n=1 Tax=Acaryochloris sp. IP29b_bin.148 TaxID=2969218 RepID=UPI0026392271|nr:hypothetical protein [Acaryochloris sp. IP29b_bin.148]
MQIFYGMSWGWGLAMAAGQLGTIALGSPALAQSSAPTESAPESAIPATVKGDCGTEQTCDQLLQTLRSQWPTAKLNCTRDRILSLRVFQNTRGGRQVQVTCWDAEVKKGDRYGLSRSTLPYPGDEAQFLPPLPRRSRYTEPLNARFPEPVRASQNECGFLGGDLQFRARKDIDRLELQCVFPVGAVLIDTDGDFVADGEASKGSLINKRVGKFAISELEKPVVAQPQASSTPIGTSTETSVEGAPLPTLSGENSVSDVFPNASSTPTTDGAVPAQTTAAPTSQGSTSANAALQAIDVQIFNRLKNQLVPLNQPWNPYGLGMDLLIAVKVKPGTQATQPGTNLVLAINAKGYDSPATGPVPAWNTVQTRSIAVSANDQFSYSFPFLAEYRCYSEVQLTATLIPPGQLASPSLTKTLDLSCAE